MALCNEGYKNVTKWAIASLSIAASLKSFGEKTASLFDRKKKDAEQVAAEKATAAQKMAEEQARKTAEAIGQTKSEVENLAADTGKIWFIWICFSKITNFLPFSAKDAAKHVGDGVNQASSAADSTRQSIGNTVNTVQSTVDQTKQQAAAALDQTKKAANEAINQGVDLVSK